MKKLALALSLLFLLNTLQGQSPYTFSKKCDGIITAATGVMLIGDYFANQSITILTTQEIYSLDASKINAFDRRATSLLSEPADFRSDMTLYASAGINVVGLGLIGVKESKEDNNTSHFFTLLFLGLETNVFAEVGTDLIKSTVKRTRPYTYNPDFPIEQKYGKNNKKSFISGHTSLAATNTFFFAKVFSDYYPESKWKPVVWTVAAIVPAWTGLDRVLAGKHFPSDVIAGYIFGATCGYLIPYLHKTSRNEQAINLQVIPFANELGNGVSLVMDF